MSHIDVEEILRKLSLDEKVSLLAGIDYWHTKALPQHKIPSIRVSDGPNGLRGTRFFNSVPAACFPCGTALGATFNQKLLEQAGQLMAREAIAKNVHVILGPTINMQRSPLGGRGFESIGEDPFLSGLCAAALVRGMQGLGIQATIKHFVCNDQEHRRNAVNALVTERALREIYLLPFQLVVRDANPGAFMTAYNGVNGTFCSENPRLLEEVLRSEWGWKGLVMSDWFGLYSTVEACKAGLDLEMPGPTAFRGDLLKFAVNSGKVWPHILDQRAREVLNFVKKCLMSQPDIEENGPEGMLNTPETAALLRKIGNESIVLLKNDNAVLPLSKTKSTLIVGPNAKVSTYCGGGSASLTAYYTITPFDGIRKKLDSSPSYTIGSYTHKLLPLLSIMTQPLGHEKPGVSWKVYNEPPQTPSREVVDELWLTTSDVYLADYQNPKVGDLWYADLEGVLIPEEDGEYDFGLVVCGLARLYIDGRMLVDNATRQVGSDNYFGIATREEIGRIRLNRGQSYNIKVEFSSAASFTLVPENNMVGGGCVRVGCCKVIDDQAEIRKAVQLAKEHDQVIVCGGLNAEWETESKDRESMKLPGTLDQLIFEVAAANPRTVVVMQTGTPEEMPWLEEVSAVIQAWYSGNETGNCIADVLFGDYNPSGKLSLSFPKKLQDVPAFINFRTEAGRTLYGEDVYLGYRYYEYAGRELNFPFGHGLSYTSFAFSDLSVTAQNDELSVTLKVTNTGSIKGAEVAQLYIQPKQSAKVNRPVKEMKGFTKVHLEPGQSKEVTIKEQIKYAVSYFDEERNQWCVEEGEYEVIISDSSAITESKTLRGSFTVGETYWWSGL